MRDSADAYGSIDSSKPSLQQFVLYEHTILSLFLQLGQGMNKYMSDNNNSNSAWTLHRRFVVRVYSEILIYFDCNCTLILSKGSEDGSELGTQSKRIAVAAISLVLPLWLIVVSSPNEDGWFWRAIVIALITSGAVYAARRMITVSNLYT
jgi:hypothetical protein